MVDYMEVAVVVENIMLVHHLKLLAPEPQVQFVLYSVTAVHSHQLIPVIYK
jgi:hypothetical protein